jgi:hypothetical protein
MRYLRAMLNKSIFPKLVCGILLLFIFSASILAQEESEAVSETFNVFSFNIGYGYEIPAGDLVNRYGDNLKFTLGSQYLTAKSWTYEFDFNLMFGDEVKEDVLSSFRNENGNLIGSNGDLADVFSRERGFFMGALIGKIFSNPNKQNGIKVAAGGGVLSHNIRFLDESSGFFQINGDYLKGYDRLTRGFALKQQIGHEYHSKNGRINLNLVFEFTQGFTENVRKYYFDQSTYVSGKRLDLLYGLRATYMLPVWRKSSIDKPTYY